MLHVFHKIFNLNFSNISFGKHGRYNLVIRNGGFRGLAVHSVRIWRMWLEWQTPLFCANCWDTSTAVTLKWTSDVTGWRTACYTNVVLIISILQKVLSTLRHCRKTICTYRAGFKAERQGHGRPGVWTKQNKRFNRFWDIFLSKITKFGFYF
jgi:hypothetical protein